MSFGEVVLFVVFLCFQVAALGMLAFAPRPKPTLDPGDVVEIGGRGYRVASFSVTRALHEPDRAFVELVDDRRYRLENSVGGGAS